MSSQEVISVMMPIIGIGMAIGVVYWQSWRDGVLPNQKPRDKK
jgi:hypothetical protein